MPINRLTARASEFVDASPARLRGFVACMLRKLATVCLIGGEQLTAAAPWLEARG